MIYRVWDELNADESDAKEFCVEEPYDAAIAYAKQDAAGLHDGLYLGDHGRELQNVEAEGHPISVRTPDGELYRFTVGITSFEPVWDAEPVP